MSEKHECQCGNLRARINDLEDAIRYIKDYRECEIGYLDKEDTIISLCVEALDGCQ